MRGPLAISNYAVRARLTGAVPVADGADYELWRPTGTPRMALFVGGLYHDGWLSPAGHLTVYPGGDGRVDGDAAVPALASDSDASRPFSASRAPASTGA